MKRTFARDAACLILLALTSCCTTQRASSRTIVSLLPTGREIQGWIHGSTGVYTGDDLFKYINGGADIFFEYGFDRLVSQKYSRGNKSIIADIYRMKDPFGAFGIYSLNRDYPSSRLGVGDEGMEKDNQISFCQSNFYVLIQTFKDDKGTKEGMRILAQSISSNIGEGGRLPKILEKLPLDNRIQRSEKLIMGIIALNNACYVSGRNILRFHGKEIAVVAEYEFPDDKFRLLLVQYENETQAKLAFKDVTEHLTKRENGFSAVRRKGRLLALVLDAKMETNADKVLGNIR